MHLVQHFEKIVLPAYTSFGHGQNFVQKGWDNGKFSHGPDDERIGSIIFLIKKLFYIFKNHLLDGCLNRCRICLKLVYEYIFRLWKYAHLLLMNIKQQFNTEDFTDEVYAGSNNFKCWLGGHWGLKIINLDPKLLCNLQSTSELYAIYLLFDVLNSNKEAAINLCIIYLLVH